MNIAKQALKKTHSCDINKVIISMFKDLESYIAEYWSSSDNNRIGKPYVFYTGIKPFFFMVCFLIHV